MNKLKNKFILFLFSFLLPVFCEAQHCPFDGSAIIVLNIHSADSNAIIPNLKIYMLDSTGKVFKGDRYMNKQWVHDTVWFWQNPNQTTFRGYIDNANPAEVEKIRFPFALNNYVTTVWDHFPIGKFKIIIEDVDGTKNGGAFKTRSLTIQNLDVYPLCTTYNDEVYHCPFRKIEYKPVDVILAKK